MTSLNDAKCPTLDLLWKTFFFKYSSHYIQQLRILSTCRVKGLKRQLSSKTSEKWLNDVSRWHHMSKTGHGMKKRFFQNISLDIITNFNCDQFVMKTKFKGLKRQFSSPLLKNDRMTSLNDVICLTLGMIWKNNIFKVIFQCVGQFSVKNKFKGLKRQLSSKMTEK